MRVEPSQLVPGCMLLNDVKGKSNRAIISRNTVLTEEHITIVEKFLIAFVDVGSKLSDGTTFQPKAIQQEKKQVKQTNDSSNLAFDEHYHYVVQNYKKLFTAWQNNIKVDMPTVRKLVIPLFKRIDQDNVDIFTLHQYNTKKDYMYHHCVGVGLLAMYLSKKMGYPSGESIQIGLAGFLSDCGMAKISPTILNKTEGLSAIEIDEMKKHPTYSYRMIEQIPTITQIVKLAILQHHERMDGSGYPLGVKKDKIHAYSRILAVSDIYHAMTCERLYQSKQSPFKVMEELIRDKYTHFSHQVVDTFSKSLTNFSIGKR
ncbi:HD-GYP domain-containing protein [Virgibacillus necropolis]|uniref:HD-GYP domain-containing protein n=1 Tax=Virgibacillus necropolis TaxID=163877 RepID=UPI001D046E61|nr:HD-GYP domain-containing protein [Virgibacillus necropolis]